ncbi:MAG: hypothetical protein LBR79_01285 [Oscillospiraceae bacterium]|nr:hypothetical protein [Oscillospiraceae bacterium]
MAGGEKRNFNYFETRPNWRGKKILDLPVNFTDCNQNRRRRIKILPGDFDAKPFLSDAFFDSLRSVRFTDRSIIN